MNEDQIRVITEALSEALDIINRNQLKIIDEKFEAIFNGKAEADDAVEPSLTEDDVRCIATDVARDVVNDSTVDISA